MTDTAAREMTPAEWAAKLVGADSEILEQAIIAAEMRGVWLGRRSLEGAVDHFETAYRYAAGARERIGKTGPDGEPEHAYVNDAFEAAAIMAKIGYEEWYKMKPYLGYRHVITPDPTVPQEGE